MNTDLTGQLLIAMPSIGDARFSKSVILVCAHSEDFAMGIVLNKPMQGLSLPLLLDQLDVPVEGSVPDKLVLDGGPVSSDRGFVVHSHDIKSDGASLPVNDELCLTATRDILVAMGSDCPPQNAILALGYAGWGAGQLEGELATNAWLIGSSNQELIFGLEHSKKWSLALKNIGVDSGRLLGQGGNA